MKAVKVQGDISPVPPTFLALTLPALVALSSAIAAGQIVIDFDDLPDNTVITNQYPEATFSSSSGNQNTAISHASANSPPNILCSGPTGGGFDCIQDTYIDFTNPVNNLTFWAIEANVAGRVAYINVWTEDVIYHFPLVSSGGAGNNEFVDVSYIPGVIRLELTAIIDDPNENGIGWDTFSFTVVPAPGTLALLGPLVLFSRRRQR